MVRRIPAATLLALLCLVIGSPASAALPAHPHASAPGCATGTRSAGSITVCPDAAPVGSTVTISGTGCHNPRQSVLAVFLGPRAWMGSSGGGVDLEIPVQGNHFRATFRIPSSYPAGGDARKTAPVMPGVHYGFAVDPAAECSVGFTVTAAASPPLASTGPSVPVAPLVVLAVVALAIGTWLTVRARPRS